jgi:HJR/Mrr/RecB family endonuclease
VNLADAVEAILREHGDGRPMHYRGITDLALEAGLLSRRGLTPEASLNSAIVTDIARRANAGEDERFVSFGRGLYGLANHRSVSVLEEAVRRNNAEVRERLRQELREMDPFAFEDLVALLLEALGFVDVEVTARSGDGGVDVRGALAVGGITNVKTAIQVKRWAKNVPGKTVRELRGGLSPHERGLIITTSDFTRDAKTEADTADRMPISLVNGEKLVALLIEHGIGVVLTEARILRLDPQTLLASSDDLLEREENQTDDENPRGQPGSGRRRAGRHPSGKNLALWPLPGGQGNFVKSMWRMLTHAADVEPTLDEFIGWMLDEFPTVNSRKSSKSYIEVLRLAGLIEPREGRLVVTTAGASYLASTDQEDLYTTMTANIAGIEETRLRIAQTPSTLRELTDYLNELLGIAWSGESQAKWRVWWLESFGKALREGDHWRAMSTPAA